MSPVIVDITFSNVESIVRRGFYPTAKSLLIWQAVHWKPHGVYVFRVQMATLCTEIGDNLCRK